MPLKTPASGRLRPRIALLVAAPLALIAATLPAPEPRGIGDPLFPHLGNPGYDVTSYDLDLTYQGDNRKPLEAVTTIRAVATAHLDRVNLDFARGVVHGVEVNGEEASFVRAGEDLVVTPRMFIPVSGPLKIIVRHTSDPVGKGDGGWIRTSDGLAMANQADAAHRVFPCNDHPSDKAYFTFRITAPDGLTAVANGLTTGRQDQGPATTWSYRTVHPMATELAQVSIGRSAVVRGTGPDGLPLRDVVPQEDRRTMDRWLRKTPAQIAWMEERVGRYPFETYGLLVADAETGFELETQTLSFFERRLFTQSRFPEWYVDSLMVHELAHHWFGNSVSPRAWTDLWLNEGHATWYEMLYADQYGKLTLEHRMRQAYRLSDSWREAGGPPAAPRLPHEGSNLGIFRPVVYGGSALVLYALREEIGREAFERLEREWVAEHEYSVAATEDFVELASEITGRDLSGFFREWLYAKKTPPMPGHPEWKTEAPDSRRR
jgi:aminopeptidase N